MHEQAVVNSASSQSTSARQKWLSLTPDKVMYTYVCDFVLSGAVVERVESYKYLGFVVHATKKVTFGTDCLLATAKQATFAMRRRCSLLGIRDPALQLFDTLVLPILSYGCEVWGVDTKCGAVAEALVCEFSEHMLGVN